MYKYRENNTINFLYLSPSFNNYQLTANFVSSIPYSLFTSTQINAFFLFKLLNFEII